MSSVIVFLAAGAWFGHAVWLLIDKDIAVTTMVWQALITGSALWVLGRRLKGK